MHRSTEVRMCSFRLYGSLAEMSQGQKREAPSFKVSHHRTADTIVLCPERPAQAFNIANAQYILVE